MRQISIAIAVIALLLASPSSAQQATRAGNPTSKQSSSSTLPPGPILGGMGTTNYVPLWASSTFLLDSIIYQIGGNVGIGTTTPAATLDVNGSINAATGYFHGYQIGNQTVLSLGASANRDLFLGVSAGGNEGGTDNTFAGYYSGGSGSAEGGGNTFIGSQAGYSNCCGEGDTYIGASAGYSGVSDWPKNNTFVGTDAGYQNTQGYANNFYGYDAGGNNTTGSYDLYIANSGPLSGTESNAIRIGTEGTQTTAYIAGIDSAILPSGVPVFISNGQLGVQASSGRFKEQVRNMGDITSALMSLRPVTFFYKSEYANGDRTLQYGLIAEEVAKVYPDLVAYDQDGQPYSVRYQYLSTMLLNEVQKEYRRTDQQAEVIAAQQAQIASQQREIEGLGQQLQLKNALLEERLSRLEKRVAVQNQVAQK